MRTLSCLVCGAIFGPRSAGKGYMQPAETCTLEDGKKVYKLLEELSGTDIKLKDLSNKCICIKCIKNCHSYYVMQKNLKTIEDVILSQFKATNMSKQTANQQEINKTNALSTQARTQESMPFPLPIKVKKEKNSSSNRSLLKKFNTTVADPASVASYMIEKDSVATVENFSKSVASIKTGSTVLTVDVERLPKEFLERFGSNNVIVNINNLNSDSSTGKVQQNNEITHYSTMLIEKEMTQENDEHGNSEQSNDQEEKEVMETEYLLGDVEILDDDDDDDDDGEESETILMSDSGLLRMIKGGANKFITLLNDSQDSNDTSHIELQVSGDDATTNAIIEAAQKRGCTYIKVDSNEGVRVKSPGSEPEDPLATNPLVVPEDMQDVLTCDGDDLYHCELCKCRKEPGEFSTPDTFVMMNHILCEHNVKVYICSICAYVARQRSDLSQHMAKSHASTNVTSNQKKYKCTECETSFSSKSLLEVHLNVHKGSRPYQCNACNKQFSSKYILQSHYKIHTKRERPYDCSICQKSFYTTYNLQQHVKTHKAQRDFNCNICGKSFLTRHNLEIHSVVHTKVKPFLCGVCDKAFARKAEIRDHMRTHTGERPFKCDVCSSSFSQRSNLHSHRRLTHAQEKRYACDLCDKRFKRKRLLDYHCRAAHTGERPFKCDICSATFVYPEHLKKHTMLHKDKRPYGCEICGKRFNSKDNRNAHRFVHSDKKPYECLLCGLGFMRKSLLYTHMTTSGHITESIVVNQPRVSQITDDADEPATENGEITNKDAECTSTQAVSEDIATLEHDNVYVEESTDQGDTLYVTNEDGDNSSLCLTTTAVQKYVTNADGDYVRLVQVSLPCGEEGWLALQDMNE